MSEIELKDRFSSYLSSEQRRDEETPNQCHMTQVFGVRRTPSCTGRQSNNALETSRVLIWGDNIQLVVLNITLQTCKGNSFKHLTTYSQVQGAVRLYTCSDNDFIKLRLLLVPVERAAINLRESLILLDSVLPLYGPSIVLLDCEFKGMCMLYNWAHLKKHAGKRVTIMMFQNISGGINKMAKGFWFYSLIMLFVTVTLIETEPPFMCPVSGSLVH